VLLARAPLDSAAQNPLVFDIAAIHPIKHRTDFGYIRPLPGGNGYIARDVTLKTMIAAMYRVSARQITGGPSWIDTQTFDIETRSDHAANLEELHTMFKNLLADRFGLKMHIEQKEGADYELLVDKAGLQMKPDGDVPDLNIPINISQPPRTFKGTKVSMSYLCWFLSNQMRDDPRPVVDKTGLKQVYDFTLTFQQDWPLDIVVGNLPPEVRSLPTLFDALPEQLGLRLVRSKGPVDQYVIDHAEMPSQN
jgi:uncharacterized protein (TIGR03435 family)